MLTGMPPIARSFAGAPSPDGIHAPSPVFLTGEELLRITSIGNAAGVALTLRGRVMRPDFGISTYEQTHAPNSNRTVATTTIALSEGWPLGFTIRATAGAPASCAVWVLLELVRGQGSAAVVVETLASGFVSTNAPLQWPGGVNAGPLDGAGCLRSITGTQPGVTSEISETVPTNARWELISFSAPLVTSATVATRDTMLTIDDGTNVYFRGLQNGAQPASTTWNWTWAQGLVNFVAMNSNSQLQGLPVGLRLGAGHRIRTLTQAIQVGDQYAAPQYLVREWFDV